MDAEQLCSFCISDLAAYQPDCVGKSTVKRLEDRFEHCPDILPVEAFATLPHPYMGHDTSGLTRTVSLQEQLVTEHETQHMPAEAGRGAGVGV